MELLLLEWLSRLLYPNTGLVTKASYQIVLKKKKKTFCKQWSFIYGCFVEKYVKK